MPRSPRSVVAPVPVRAASLALALALAGAACPSPTPPPVPRGPVAPARGAVTVSIIGTNDLHGAIERLPIFGGYVANLRAVRAAEGGAVVLIDAGDMFQGTLASNLNEGAAVVAAYDMLGYAAAAVGNHEFDFGPEGPKVMAESVEDDPRGALRARALEADFPLLIGNVLDAASGNRVRWKNMPASTVVEAAGVKLGVIGVTTESTPFTTLPANFVGLRMQPPAEVVIAEAARLRQDGVSAIIVTAHIGSKCADHTDPNDISSCDTDEELFTVLRALPAGAVDVVVAGHTHAAMAHRIGDVAVIESYSSGRAFGRVDLRVSADGRVTGKAIHPPRDLCPVDAEGNPVAVTACTGQTYEGAPVVPDARIHTVIAPYLEAARARSEEKLGVEVSATITRAYDRESALGNLFTDLMLAAYPDADIALTNGGGLRADLPAGPLTYGALFQANPFDNRFARVTLQGRHVRRLVANNLAGSSGVFSWGGLTVGARCKAGQLEVSLTRKGKVVADDDTLTLITSEFLASGGDGAVGRLKLPDGAVTIDNVIIRESMAAQLKKRGGRLDPARLLDPHKPRLAYPGQRPVKCAPPPAAPGAGSGDQPD
jgi:2',3'-cyclic-nucleotide 2'-phosphodiesterase (5'-nucleotidase family)